MTARRTTRKSASPLLFFGLGVGTLLLGSCARLGCLRSEATARPVAAVAAQPVAAPAIAADAGVEVAPWDGPLLVIDDSFEPADAPLPEDQHLALLATLCDAPGEDAATAALAASDVAARVARNLGPGPWVSFGSDGVVAEPASRAVCAGGGCANPQVGVVVHGSFALAPRALVGDDEVAQFERWVGGPACDVGECETWVADGLLVQVRGTWGDGDSELFDGLAARFWRVTGRSDDEPPPTWTPVRPTGHARGLPRPIVALRDAAGGLRIGWHHGSGIQAGEAWLTKLEVRDGALVQTDRGRSFPGSVGGDCD